MFFCFFQHALVMCCSSSWCIRCVITKSRKMTWKWEIVTGSITHTLHAVRLMAYGPWDWWPMAPRPWPVRLMAYDPWDWWPMTRRPSHSLLAVWGSEWTPRCTILILILSLTLTLALRTDYDSQQRVTPQCRLSAATQLRFRPFLKQECRSIPPRESDRRDV